MRLGEYLSRPLPDWDWVDLDCCRWVDGWIQARGHASPMAAIGVQYDSERSAMRRIAEGGGLAPLWVNGMKAVGLPIVAWDQVAAGDVGVIERETACGFNQAAGIWTGERWATLGLRGYDFGPATTHVTWRV